MLFHLWWMVLQEKRKILIKQNIHMIREMTGTEEVEWITEFKVQTKFIFQKNLLRT